MPYNPNLDIDITDAQATAIVADLESAQNALGAIATVTLSPDEVRSLNTINNVRLPYVQRVVTEFAPQYPSLVSRRIAPDRAARLFKSYLTIRALQAKLKEFTDRVNDLSYNVENLLYLFTTDMYYDAKRLENDVPGADVVEDYLKELFENQGPQNPTT